MEKGLRAKQKNRSVKYEKIHYKTEKKRIGNHKWEQKFDWVNNTESAELVVN